MLVLLLTLTGSVVAQSDSPPPVVEVCPRVGIQPRPAGFQPGGIILTTFDRANLWVLNLDRGTRYPLPETRPCGTNCHLSRDARWITYLNAQDGSFSKMRLDGTQRTPLVSNATDVEWWSADTLLVWSPSQQAALLPESGGTRQPLDNSQAVVSVQPGGLWAVALRYDGEGFTREMIDLETRDIGFEVRPRVTLGPDLPFANSTEWSPDGTTLAFVTADPDSLAGAVYTAQPGQRSTLQRTAFATPSRIGGQTPAGGLSWSPDSRKVAFWVMPLTGADPAVDVGDAVLHVLDLDSGTVRRYCDYTTFEHTPNPPRLIWSPDSTHVAFGGNVPDDNRGYLLLALNVESGVFTELSEGIFPALGSADVIAWGLPPG